MKTETEMFLNESTNTNYSCFFFISFVNIVGFRNKQKKKLAVSVDQYQRKITLTIWFVCILLVDDDNKVCNDHLIDNFCLTYQNLLN